MGLLEGFWHVLNFMVVGLLAGCIAAALAKAVWRRELSAQPFVRLAAAASVAAVLALALGWMLLGRDGRMGSYLAMVCAMAAALAWVGFRR